MKIIEVLNEPSTTLVESNHAVVSASDYPDYLVEKSCGCRAELLSFGSAFEREEIVSKCAKHA